MTLIACHKKKTFSLDKTNRTDINLVMWYMTDIERLFYTKMSKQQLL